MSQTPFRYIYAWGRDTESMDGICYLWGNSTDWGGLAADYGADVA